MEATLLSAGLACVIAGIIGGGLKAFGVEIPALTSSRRQAALIIFGLFLLGLLAWNSHFEKEVPSHDTKETKTDATEEKDFDAPLRTIVQVGSNDKIESLQGKRITQRTWQGSVSMPGGDCNVYNIFSSYFKYTCSFIVSDEHAASKLAKTLRQSALNIHARDFDIREDIAHYELMWEPHAHLDIFAIKRDVQGHWEVTLDVEHRDYIPPAGTKAPDSN